MKRGAENQLTKDSLSDDEEIQEMPGAGFRKADQSTLASRPMRGLPKRTGSANSASAPALGSTPTEPPKFGGFAGFGATSGSSTSSSPFLFKPPSTTATVPPAVSTTASNTAKTFASFLGSGATANPAPPQSATQTKPAATNEDPAALKYYTSLRGLNISVISALSKTTEEDPFKDVTDVLEQYKAFRSQIQKEYDDQKSKTPAEAPAAPPAAPKPAFSLPSVPSSFAGFGGTTAPASAPSVPSLGSGFTPKASTTSSSSLFTLPASSSTPSAPAPPTTQSSFSFSTSTPSASQGASASNPFSFSTSSTNTTKEAPTLSSSSIFGAPPKLASTAPASSFSSPFSFGGNTSAPKTSALGVPSTSSSGGFTFGAPTTSTLDSSKPTPGSLGAFGSFKSNAPDAAATPASPPKGGFAGFSGFGKPSSGGSLGNPVGFGFGAAAKTPEVDSSVTSAAASGSEDNGGADSGEAGNNVKTESFSLFGNNPHDEEGEGEEDEETTFQVKLKVYRLKRADDKEGTGWKELGYGVLRLKKHKETGKRRMLLRNSSTGKIHINFNLYSGMKPPTLTKKSLTFMGFEGTIPQNYNVRLPNEEKAAELKAAIEKEVAEIP